MSQLYLNIEEVLIITIIGLMSIAGYFLQIMASKYEKASKLSIMWFTEIIFAFFFLIAIFNGRVQNG